MLLNPSLIGEVSLQLRGAEEMRYIALVTLAAALMLPAPAARAVPMTFGGILSGANEVPPVSSPGAGTVAVVLDPTAETIQILASFFGLTTPDIMAHIARRSAPTWASPLHCLRLPGSLWE